MSLFVNGVHINLQEMSFLKDILIGSEAHFVVLIVQSSSIFSGVELKFATYGFMHSSLW